MTVVNEDRLPPGLREMANQTGVPLRDVTAALNSGVEAKQIARFLGALVEKGQQAGYINLKLLSAKPMPKGKRSSIWGASSRQKRPKRPQPQPLRGHIKERKTLPQKAPSRRDKVIFQVKSATDFELEGDRIASVRSLGQKQRVTISGGSSSRPKTLIATEVFTKGNALMVRVIDGLSTKKYRVGTWIRNWTPTETAPPPLPRRQLPSKRGRQSEPMPLHWTVLPNQWWNSGVRSTDRGLGPGGRRRVRQYDPQRVAFVDSLGPTEWYEGSHLGQSIYYVAIFDSIAVADSPEFGNALYWVRREGDSWKSVFRLTKREALEAGAHRIIHTPTWKERLTRILES